MLCLFKVVGIFVCFFRTSHFILRSLRISFYYYYFWKQLSERNWGRFVLSEEALCSSFKTSWELRPSLHGGQIVTLTHNACLQVSFNSFRGVDSESDRQDAEQLTVIFQPPAFKLQLLQRGFLFPALTRNTVSWRTWASAQEPLTFLTKQTRVTLKVTLVLSFQQVQPLVLIGS